MKNTWVFSEIQITGKTLKKTNLGVAQALFDA